MNTLEAATRIMRAVADAGTTQIKQFDDVRKILDQIDQSQQGFSVREMCELIGKSADMNHVTIDYSLDWRIATEECDIEVSGLGIDELKAKLIELATPPKPKTVMVEMPIEWVRLVAENGGAELALRCRDALAKLETQP